MPLPIIAAGALIGKITAWAGAGYVGANVLLDAADKAIDAYRVAQAIYEWWDTDGPAKLVTEKLNAKLARAGVDLQFAPFNPLTDLGRESARRELEGYILGKINSKAGTNIETLSGLDQDTFLAAVSAGMARKLNSNYGTQITALWPADTLGAQLQSEVLRQFDNRGRYTAGNLFPRSAIARVTEKIAGKHPEYQPDTTSDLTGGINQRWGPPRDEKHRRQRELGRERQERYKNTHQQTWVDRPGGRDPNAYDHR